MHAPGADDLPRLEETSHGKVTVYLNPDYAGGIDLEDLRRLPSILASLGGRSSRQAGRSSLWSWHPQWHDGPGLMVRQYVHGGLLGPVRGSLFLSDGRMRRELQLAAYARRRGVPTSAPLAVRVERAWGPLVKGYFVSEKIPEAMNLLELCESVSAGHVPSRQQSRDLAAAIAGAIADMHDAGILHADLNLKNVLVRNPFDAPEAYVIDFDRAELTPQPTLRQRLANLLRLDRSVVKWAASRRAVAPADRLRTLRCYLARYPEWESRWGRIARRHAGRHTRHHLARQPDGQGSRR